MAEQALIGALTLQIQTLLQIQQLHVFIQAKASTLNTPILPDTRFQMGVFLEMLALEWMDTRGVLIFIFVFLILADYLRNRSPSNFPPGPWTFPIIRDTYRVHPNKMHLDFEKVCLL